MAMCSKPARSCDPRALWHIFLVKRAALARHRAYADALLRATNDTGGGRTPVRPLATANAGGPLVCDVCGRPLVLQCGRYDRKTAAEGWEANGRRDFDAFILGGVVFEVVVNGTIRVYHGHVADSAGECSTIGHAKLDADEAAFVPERPYRVLDLIAEYLRSEGETEADSFRLAGEAVALLYNYDPGVGKNGPA